MDIYEMLANHISELVPLTDEDNSIIRDVFEKRELRKKEILLFKGDVSRHMRFIANGCLRAYNIDEKGQEHILQFGLEGWWVNDLYSYLTETPAKFFVQAVEKSVVLQIHKDTLEQLFDRSPRIERFFRLKFQNAYVALQDRTVHALSKPAEERYADFRKTYPEIEQRVPQYMIASYLGITPEFLSSIRNKISKS